MSTPLLSSLVYMIVITDTTAARECLESVQFKPILKAYPMCHSWIITGHISLGNLERHWKSFARQMDRTQQLLQSLHQRPSAPTHLISTLQAELTNLNDIYTSYRPVIIAATHPINTKPSFNGSSGYNKHTKRSLLPCLGNALSWLTGTATTKDVTSIKKRVNQLITAQAKQQETLVHIVSILNITRYAIQINGQHINIVIDAVDRMEQDVNNLSNITNSLYTSLSYRQLVLHIRSILANLRDSLSYIRTVSTHTMDYINAATTGTLSPHILQIEYLRQMLSHIEEALPLTLHLPVSSKDTLYFYQYLCIHILITNKQFLLLIDVPIQDHKQQLALYEVFTLDIPHGNFLSTL